MAILLVSGCGLFSSAPEPAAPPAGAAAEQPPAPAQAARPKKTSPQPIANPEPGACAGPPFTVLGAVYQPYLAKQPIPALRAATCWTPETLALFERAAAREEADGTPVVDFDPIVDAQDFDLKDFRIKPVDNDTWTASFSNFDKATTITWELRITERGIWVDDVRTDTWSLKALLQ